MLPKVKIMVVVLILGCSMFLLMGRQGSVNEWPRFPGDEAGYRLLDSMGAFFSELERTGKGESDTIIKALNEWMAAAEKAKTDGKIDTVFFKRYKRIVVVIRLICFPRNSNRILNELLVREINQFDIKPLDEDFEVEGIASIAVSLKEEIKSLKKYLDKKR